MKPQRLLSKESKAKILLTTIITGCCLSTIATHADTLDLANNEHAITDVDISQPIAALDNLTSIHNNEKLNMTIPEFQHFTSNNGVPVIFVQTKQLPIVDVELRFNAGSARDESIKKNGFGLASMVATSLTKGTTQLNETEFAKATEQLGIELSSAAYKDQFIVKLRSLSDDEHLTPALKLMSSVLNEPRFDSEVFERSKAQQVLGLKQMLQNPAYVASTVFNQTLYGTHPYAHSSFGTIETIPNLSTTDLKKFHDTYLVAGNATLSITGDLTLAQAKQVAEVTTQHLPKGQPAPPLPTPKPGEKSKWVHIDFDSDQTSVIIGQLGYRVDADALQKGTAFSIGNEVLAGSGFNSRLMGKVRKELGYTYGIYGNVTPMQVEGPYTIRFSTRNEKAGEAIKATLDTVNQTLQHGITEAEFQLTKENLINSYPMGFSSNAGINGMVGSINFNQLPDTYITQYIHRIENTNIEEVNDILSSTLTPDKFIIITVGKPDLDKATLPYRQP